MLRGKKALLVLALAASVSLSAVAAVDYIQPLTNPDGGVGFWLLNNTLGQTVTGVQVEFGEPVTLLSSNAIGGGLIPLQGTAGSSFTFVGELVPYGTLPLEWTPASAVPTFITWLDGERAIGTPYFTTVDKLGYLLGAGIVYMREADPATLAAAFQKFFTDNQAYLATVSQSLGMDLATSLMPIIMSAPAEGIQNFFNTIVGMLGVTSLEDLLGGAVDFSSLLALLGM
ncbi:MAG: hypothetical protein AB1778_08935 [Candidatus Bipolaricaulota bacterium]